MVRRIASQVHQQVSRLMRANVIQRPPVWYNAVLEHPPLPLPAKSPPPRTPYDATPKEPTKKSNPKPAQIKPLPIHYIEDDIRRQFFRDHPFEAFRPRTLTEGEAIEMPHEIQGKEWTRLRQRGRNPSSEDCIQFAVNLYQHHSVPLSHAYARAVGQFRALRSEHHIASTFALVEAEHLGAEFPPSEIDRGFEKELASLSTWQRQAELDEGALAARKRWRAIVQDHSGNREWTKGQEYVRLWKEGVRPTYAPALTEPIQL